MNYCLPQSSKECWIFNAEQLMRAVPALADFKSALSKQMLELLRTEQFNHESGFLDAFKLLRKFNQRERKSTCR